MPLQFSTEDQQKLSEIAHVIECYLRRAAGCVRNRIMEGHTLSSASEDESVQHWIRAAKRESEKMFKIKPLVKELQTEDIPF